MLVYIISVLLAFVLYVKWKHSYLKRRGLYQFDTDFFFGNFRDELLGRASLFQAFYDKYTQLKALKQKHGGVYMLLKPIYIPVDLAIIKGMVQKDFAYFLGHVDNHHPKDIISMHLFNLYGESWRKLRTKLTPTFTSGKMKLMFEIVVEKTKGLEKLVRSYVEKNEPVDIKEVIARFTTDIVASCGFGIESNCLEEAESEFRRYGRKVFDTRAWKQFALNTFPRSVLNVMYQLGFTSFSREVNDFMTKTVMDTIEYRQKFKVYRKDFMHLLMELRNHEKGVSHSLTDEEIIAQCFVFYAAGYETTSTATTFALLELSQNQDVQERLRDEIKDVLEKYDGKITYDALMEMVYLEMVINETLRKYPPIPLIPRLCTKDYQVPGTNVIIEKGTQVQIPIWGIQNDPEYYPNPEKFNPENFSPENKPNIPDMAFIPFGDGPRMCIGLRFGMLQSKVALVSLLRNFRFTLNEKTKTPIRPAKISLVLSVEGDVWLNATEL